MCEYCGGDSRTLYKYGYKKFFRDGEARRL